MKHLSKQKGSVYYPRNTSGSGVCILFEQHLRKGLYTIMSKVIKCRQRKNLTSVTNFDFNGIFLDAEATTESSQTGAEKKTIPQAARSAPQKASGSSVDNGPVQRKTRGEWPVGIFGHQSKAIKGTVCCTSYHISYHPRP